MRVLVRLPTLLILLNFLGTAHASETQPALPASIVMRTELKPAGTPYTFEIITGTAEGEAQLHDVAQWIAKDLREAEQKNPRLLSVISSIENQEEGRSPQSENPPRDWRTVFRNFTQKIATSQTITSVENAPASIKNWYGVPANRLRLNFTLIKGSLMGGIQFYAMMHASDHLQPFWHAAGVGTTVGLLCGGLTFANPWINKTLGEAPWVKKYLSLQNKKLRMTAEYLENTAKFYLIEVGFIGTIKLTSALIALKLGMLTFDHASVAAAVGSLLPEAASIATIAIWSTLTQSMFEIGIAREHQRDSQAASQLPKNDAERTLTRIELRTQLLKVLSSGLSVYGALAEGHSSTVALGTLGVIGVTNMVRVYRADVLKSATKLKQNIQTRCQRLLERMSSLDLFWGDRRPLA